jgi:hypothetical protein
LFSVQGLSASVFNSNGVVTNVLARNGATVRFNKFQNLAVSGIHCDSSDFKIEDSYPTIYGKGTGTFSSVRVEGLIETSNNLIPDPYFTSASSLSWTESISGASSSISHVNDTALGKYVAGIQVTSGSSGDYAFYVSPTITVGSEEYVSIGGLLKATTGRPYIEIQYRNGSTALDTYRAAGGTTADNTWQKFLKFSKTPATCDNVRILIGGNFDAVGNFGGRFDGLWVYRNTFLLDAGEVCGSLFANKAYDPPSLNNSNAVTTTVTCTGAELGMFCSASFDNDLQDITVHAWVSSANTVSVRFLNLTGGTVDLANGVLKVKVYNC